MNEMTTGNWAQSASEVAKNSALTLSLEGWPAAAAIISFPAACVLIYAIKAFAPNT